MVAKEIGLTVEDVLRASLDALGIDARTMEDRVFDTYVGLARERHELPTAADVARALGVAASTVAGAAARMAEANPPRMVSVPCGKGKAKYVPLVARG